jgi:hypothetical protein
MAHPLQVSVRRWGLARAGSPSPVGADTLSEVKLGVDGYPSLLVSGLNALEIGLGGIQADPEVVAVEPRVRPEP